ncbi:MAG: winged helix-turn-helix transcriptional regulator [Deltaproteobacteria bacterium]|nr:winged helix-turn-helix transcriptional regulator [Deltaproteobacteria bacterium]MBW2119712.1 winged helix-turn-helix transcriptional regulator [Deltaproteobacteria bacterium]MBW2342537.1 winged helix-turn-helix transcriptional regulator [Deltaproteobacteria bacterium]
MDKENIHILRLMGEIERDASPSQRELSSRLNLSLGLVNTFIKRLVNKGYFKVKTMPRNRARYFLTPKGLARKSRLTVEYLQYSVNFYKDIKNLLINKFKEMEKARLNTVMFFGAGEVAELAYLYLQLTDLHLVGIVENSQDGGDFFEFGVDGLDLLDQKDWDVILLTRLDNTDQDIETLVEMGVNPDKIAVL